MLSGPAGARANQRLANKAYGQQDQQVARAGMHRGGKLPWGRPGEGALGSGATLGPGAPLGPGSGSHYSLDGSQILLLHIEEILASQAWASSTGFLFLKIKRTKLKVIVSVTQSTIQSDVGFILENQEWEIITVSRILMNGILSFLEKRFLCTEGGWSAWRPTVITVRRVAPVGNGCPGGLPHD